MLDQNLNVSNATENTETTSKSAESQRHKTSMQIRPKSQLLLISLAAQKYYFARVKAAQLVTK